MNSQEAKLKRLLNLFPKSAIRLQWNPEARRKAEAIEDVIETVDEERITEFVQNNFGCTKQHSWLFSHELENLRDFPDDPFGLGGCTAVTGDEEITFFYLVELEFLVYLDKPLETTTIEFLWPARIKVSDEWVWLSLTIMEKNVEAYLEGDRPVLKSSRNIDDKQLLSAMLATVPAHGSFTPLDLNRGVKRLWDAGRIDAPYVQWKKPRSTSTEVMDEDFLIRRDYPELYAEIKDQPLFKTLFKFVGDKNPPVSHFIAEPTNGIIIFSTFSSDPRSTEYVVTEILRLNR